MRTDTTIQHDPWDITLEQTVLGACLKDNSQIDIAAADLTSANFYDPLHGRIFDLIVVLMADGEGVTPLIVHSVMKSDPGLAECGGLGYLEAMVVAAPGLPNMRSWIKQMQDLALRRDLQSIAAELSAAAVLPPSEMTGRQAADMATEALLRAGRAGAKAVRSLRDIAMDAIHEIEDVRAGKPVPIVPSGLHKLDAKIGGFRGGDLITIAAHSGMGKSTLMGTFAVNAARAGFPTIFFSLEMTEGQLAQRMMADLDFGHHEKAMWYSKVRNHRLNDDEFARYILAAQSTDGWPIEIVDEAGLTMQQISAKARAFKAKHGNKIGMALIDYFQKVAAADPRENRERQVSAIASGAKDLAKILGWPVICGSQFNEDAKARGENEKRPRASDVRESKGIQHESDLMLSPWRDAYWLEKSKPLGAVPGESAWQIWADQMRPLRHRMDLLGLKYRHGAEFDTELFCDMAASAIRDERPLRMTLAEEEAARDLLTTVSG